MNIGADSGAANPCLSVPAGSCQRRWLRRALAFMNDNLGEPLSLQAVASAAGLSRFHFARMFRVETGHSPMEYLMLQRIERSKHLLLHDAPSISTVAALLGFCDQSH